MSSNFQTGKGEEKGGMKIGIVSPDFERTGRPLGSKAFIERLERKLGRRLSPQKAGRKPAKGKKRAA